MERACVRAAVVVVLPAHRKLAGIPDAAQQAAPRRANHTQHMALFIDYFRTNGTALPSVIRASTMI